MVASIEFIENVVMTYRRAKELNLATESREGNTVVLGPDRADEVMVTGDLHGNRRNFNLIRKIVALDKHPRRHLVLQEVCHGGATYPGNGGCMSHVLLEDVAKLKVVFPEQVHFLLSNHELAEITDYPIQKNRQMLNVLFRLGLQQMYGAAAEKVREAYVRFLQSCPLAVRVPGAFICHSIPERCDSMRFDPTIFTRALNSLEFYDRSSVFDLVWGRDYRPENAEAFARMVQTEVIVNGHDPTPEGFSVPNTRQIILDCCGKMAGYLMLRTDRPATHAELIKQVRFLG